MTKEQAIELLKDIKHGNYLGGIIDIPSDEATAFDMAIKALEQQPSKDCVSRADVIDELNRLGRNAFKDDTDYDNFFAFVDGLPPVAPTFPKGATNGDVIKAIFPSLKIANDGLINDNLTGIIAFYGGYGSPLPSGDNYFNRKWWNTPYKPKQTLAYADQSGMEGEGT